MSTFVQANDFSRTTSAVVVMDFQNNILKNVPDAATILRNAAVILESVRANGFRLIYVQHRGGAYAIDEPGSAFADAVKPLSGEKILPKTKPGPFSTTALDVTLREMGVETLVLLGVTTSGCVLTATRWAVDLNYKFVVIADACGDREPEVHDFLVQRLFPKWGTVATAAQFQNMIAVTTDAA